MSVTEQRSGFRLPWATEPKPHDAPAQSAAAVAQPADALEPAAVPEPDPGSLAWPAVDRPRTPQALAAVVDPATVTLAETTAEAAAETGETAAVPDPVPVGGTAGPTRRDNPLLAGLVRAMRDAANVARAEAAATAAADAEARVEALRTEAAAASTDLRKHADEDLAAIRDWSRAQLARIREETERRTADRKARLDRDLEIRTIRLDARIDAVAAVTADFEERMAAFYDTLLAEDDPARLAGLAERLPEPPTFEDLDDWVVRTEVLDPDDAAAAEAAAMAGLDELEPFAFEDEAAHPAGADGPSADTAPMADQMAASRVERRLMVTGLASVASIAGFRRALARIAGVTAVSVTSGPDGEFVFSVAHGPDTDLPAAVAGLSAFRPVLDLRADGTITASVTEPDDHV